MKIAVITDSGSGLEPKDIKNDNLFLIGMPFMIDGVEYFEDVNITKKEFFELIKNPDVSVSTSQPSLYTVKELWDKVLEKYDAIIHIPLSSGLSASFIQAQRLANEEYEGIVFVVDNNRVSVTERASVKDALDMIEDGLEPKEIVEYLTKTKLDSSIYIMVDDLTLLKKGGRVTPKAQALASVLHIKPVLQIQGGKLDAYKKVISASVAKKVLLNAVKNDLEGRFKQYYENGEMEIAIAHSDDPVQANALLNQVKIKFPNVNVRYVDYLSCLISCHTGPKALGLGCYRVYKTK